MKQLMRPGVTAAGRDEALAPLCGVRQTGCMPAESGLKDARALLKRVYGYDAFRGLQEAVIADVLAGRDGLAVLPTGGGK